MLSQVFPKDFSHNYPDIDILVTVCIKENLSFDILLKFEL